MRALPASAIVVCIAANQTKSGSALRTLPIPPPDRIGIAFDDRRLVAAAGLPLPMSLAHRLGLGRLADELLDLGRTPGRAHAGDKLLGLTASALAGRRLHRRRRRSEPRRHGRSGLGLSPIPGASGIEGIRTP